MGVSAFDSYASAPAPAATRGPIPDLDYATGRYRVRFAHDAADLEEVGRLRFRVFNLEEGEGLAESWDTGVDKDLFDDQCQHLLGLLDNPDLEKIALWKLDGFTDEEVATRLGRTRRTVQRQLQLIRKIWQHELSESSGSERNE